MELISVVIPTLNRPDDLRRCLESIVAQTLPADEVIVVDQSTSDLTRELVGRFKIVTEGRIKNWIYLRQEQKSLVHARNNGVKSASGEIICFLDDDIVLFPDYFEKIMPYFRDPEIGGVSGNVVVVKKRTDIKWELRKLIMRFFLLSNFDAQMTPSSFGYPIYEREIDRKMYVDFLPGCTMTYRKELAMKELSDEWFSGYSYREDVDLSYRISRHAKLILIPEARFHHNHSQVNRLDIFDLKKMQFKNLEYLFKKHRPQTWFYRTLFVYSMFGLVLLDLFGLLLNFSQQKKDAVKADIIGILALGSKGDNLS